MATITITLDEKEQMWLQEIIVDRDKDQALEFIEKCIKAKIGEQGKAHAHCKPPF